MYDQIGGTHKRSAALKARMNIAAEAADTGEDILGTASNSNMQGVISLGNMNKFQSMNDHQKYMRHQQQQHQQQQQHHQQQLQQQQQQQQQQHQQQQQQQQHGWQSHQQYH